MSRRWLLLLGALGCARAKAPPAPDPFAGPGAPSAALVERARIDLRWSPPGSEAAGAWVEFATPGSDFVKLEVAWPGRTSFTHDELAPATTFLYRLVPFFGRSSPEIGVRTGASDQPPGEPEGPVDAPGPAATGRSLRGPLTLAQAAPDELSATMTAPTTAVLRWRDRAADEDGFLVELASGSNEFQVCALLPPDTTSFRKVGLPAQAQLRFRVRAFFLGPPSTVASAATPP